MMHIKIYCGLLCFTIFGVSFAFASDTLLRCEAEENKDINYSVVINSKFEGILKVSDKSSSPVAECRLTTTYPFATIGRVPKIVLRMVSDCKYSNEKAQNLFNIKKHLRLTIKDYNNPKIRKVEFPFFSMSPSRQCIVESIDTDRFFSLISEYQSKYPR